MAKRLSIKSISEFIRRRVTESTVVQFAVRKAIEIRLRPLFNQLREDMIEEFLNHPVTEEIALGPKLNWGSPLLGGYGDLFSFIGFDKSDDPIKPIVELFRGLRLFSVTSKGLDHKFEVRFFPTMDDVESVTPMPWAEGRSWASGIEHGISGLGSYLNKEHPVSRSTAGIQAKKKDGSPAKLRSGKFQNTPYISQILNKYRAKFLELSSVKVFNRPK